MITYTTGNILESNAEAIINTVNTVGVMGAGLALAVKNRYPEVFRHYKAACRRGGVYIGYCQVVPTEEAHGTQWVINFPTKKHWRDPSQLGWVISGLMDLREVLVEYGITSVAIPPLGCGLGGLKWAEVRPIIEDGLADLPDVNIIIYEPRR